MDADRQQPAPAAPSPASAGSVLREAAGHLAEHSGGAVLLFGLEAGAAQLRAAAGVASPEHARQAAVAAADAVRAALLEARESALAPLPSLGRRGAGATWVLPVALEHRVLGVALLGLPEPRPAAGLRRSVNLVLECLAARLAHAARTAGEAKPSEDGPGADGSPSPDADALLRLSEQLFEQDIELKRSRERLGKVERLKDDFIEKMSRELRTPLNSIIEAIIGVLAGENETLSDGSRHSLRRALDDGTAFLRTLQNILDLWRVKQDELPVEIQEVNFREVVEEAIFSVQDTIDGKPIVIEKRLPEDLPRLRTDLGKLSQILFLLLDNAVKFTPRGRVTIEAGLEDGRLWCAVSDTGIGICPDDQQFIFDDFYQVDDTASSRYRGSGLGLALVRDLLPLLGGEISVTSEPGCGSSFRFEIPVHLAR